MNRVEKIINGIAKSGRVAGAYLFLGPPGVGKRQAAEAFAETLKCKKQDKFIISPTGATLKIDQVRELQGWVRFGPSASKYLVVIVAKADTLTDQAAAAFLKTLEEPAPGVVFVLLAERPDRIPTTIISRCQQIVFSENQMDWQPDPEFSPFYKELEGLNKKGIIELLKLSAKLEKERETLEEILYNLSYFARHKLSNTRYARIILDAIRQIKRRVNVKIALDVMCLKMGEANG